MRVSHEFVDVVPETLAPKTLYVCIPYSTALHACFCGCGYEVVTPLSPTDWALTFDGDSVTLDPSIGNWSLPCKSHYWLRQSEVVWAGAWGRGEIELGREMTRLAKRRYFESADPDLGNGTPHRHWLCRLLARVRRLIR